MSRKEYLSYPAKASGGGAENDSPLHAPGAEWREKEVETAGRLPRIGRVHVPVVWVGRDGVAERPPSVGQVTLWIQAARRQTAGFAPTTIVGLRLPRL
jgi:hypothetical protein